MESRCITYKRNLHRLMVFYMHREADLVVDHVVGVMFFLEPNELMDIDHIMD